MTKGRKDDAGKMRWDLLPWDALEEVVKVMTDGAAKYGDDNWKSLEHSKRRLLAAAQRHIVAYYKGEEVADDTGSHHIAHAITDLLMLLWHQRNFEKVVKGEPHG